MNSILCHSTARSFQQICIKTTWILNPADVNNHTPVLKNKMQWLFSRLFITCSHPMQLLLVLVQANYSIIYYCQHDHSLEESTSNDVSSQQTAQMVYYIGVPKILLLFLNKGREK